LTIDDCISHRAAGHTEKTEDSRQKAGESKIAESGKGKEHGTNSRQYAVGRRRELLV